MAANNNNSRNSNSGKVTMKKDTLMWVGLLGLIILVIIALYYVQKKRAEGFENISIKPQSGECVVALFYADWCGHCKQFKPEFEEAMDKLNGQTDKNGKKLRLVKVDCDAQKELASEYNISGYPTVKILNDSGSVIEYKGDRTFEGLRKYLVSDN